jgi:hypothetical protein
MTNAHILDDPQHCLDRAEEMRRLAEDMREPETRRMMLSIAEGYDKLAERAKERARQNPKVDNVPSRDK